MIQKVLKVGTSAAVTIHKDSLKELGLKIGDEVRVEVDKKKKGVFIGHLHTVDQETLDWTNSFIERYKDALVALADK